MSGGMHISWEHCGKCTVDCLHWVLALAMSPDTVWLMLSKAKTFLKPSHTSFLLCGFFIIQSAKQGKALNTIKADYNLESK